MKTPKLRALQMRTQRDQAKKAAADLRLCAASLLTLASVYEQQQWFFAVEATDAQEAEDREEAAAKATVDVSRLRKV